MIEGPDRSYRNYGDGTSPQVAVRVSDPDLPRKLMFSPDLAIGEAYVDARLTIENDDLPGFLHLLLLNRGMGNTGAAIQTNLLLRRMVRRLRQRNPMPSAQKNVAHHYDLSPEFYALFLDEDRQYSCAYFRHPDDTLEQAQARKKAHIARKLLLEPGMRVFEIGCGWGGMAITLARDYGANVVGVTLSKEQYAIARARVKQAGLAAQVDIRLIDYRKVNETFDRVVSVGMFEHVGVPHYREFFGHVRERLAGDGVALIHTIGRRSPPGSTSPWITRYIFPGGYIPALSEVMKAVEKERLWATDIEFWRLHYAETLLHWRRRFERNIDTARALYDEQFCRMWRYYLVASEMSFRDLDHEVFQIQLARRVDTVPVTRDYLCG
ncbi:class I SAM-dependent methyltransferase [Tropicimonas sp.]|uniref:class I SAM-dependent methyltransferase n=1 Tax=Tropicimonas sp. TaxID=2067044 RepID=UPI003A8443AF